MKAEPSTKFGINRVLQPVNFLPQAASKLDASSAVTDTEALVKVEQLNLDSASFHQIQQSHSGDVVEMRREILSTVASHGKMHNQVTGSGGVLIGEVSQVGPDFKGTVRVGDRIVTLISLTATPLLLDSVSEDWTGEGPVVPVEGTAVLTDGAIFAVLPDDVPESVALAVYDVCGAPALLERVLRRPMIDGKTPSRVLILGGGKSASLCAVASRNLGLDVVVVVPREDERARLIDLDIARRVVVSDARNPLGTLSDLRALLSGEKLPDVTVVCVNVPGVEHTALVATREGGTVIYFSMATSFSTVALGAEALGHDVELLIGSGYVPGHAESALQLVREHTGLFRFFESL